MSSKPYPRFRFLPVLTVLLGGIGLSLAGCASAPKTTASIKETDDKRVVLSEAEYEYVFVTGSNIPMRVPKNPIARPLLTASPVRVISPDDFDAWVQRGQMGVGR